tara:strand:- start:2449 stop:3387 length:939 start_codon:yes stop_codon:yes gene_type:complete
MNKSDIENPSGDTSGGFVIPFLTPIYNLIIRLSPAQIDFSSAIWSTFSILIILLLVSVKPDFVGFLIIVVLITLVVEFFSLNPNLFRKMLPLGSNQRVENFMETIEKRSLTSVLDFLDKEKLNQSQLKKILGTKHRHHLELYKRISSTQFFDVELIDFILSNELRKYVTPVVLSYFVGRSKTMLNVDTFRKLHDVGGLRLRGSLAIKNPELINKNTCLQVISSPFLLISSKISYFFNDPIVKFTLVGVMMFSLVAWVLGINPMPEIENLSEQISYMVGNLVAAFIVCSVVLLFLLKVRRIITVHFWGFLYRS